MRRALALRRAAAAAGSSSTLAARRRALYLQPARQLHPGFIAAAVGAGLAYAARKWSQFTNSGGSSDPKSGAGGSGSASGSGGDSWSAEYVRRVRAAAEEQEKRYAKAADEYWNYQLFMAQRAREFRERAERAKATRAGQQHDHQQWTHQYRRPDPNAGRFRHWSEDPDTAGSGAYSTFTGSGYGGSSGSGGGGSAVSAEVLSARRVLGLSPTAAVSEETVKSAFHAKAMAVHPDRPNGSAAEFRRVNAAYHTLIAHAVPARPAAAAASAGASAASASATARRPPPRR